MSKTHDHDNELADLWSRRESLKDKEWERLYIVVREALIKRPVPELSSLPGEKDEYVEDFFLKKVFQKDKKTSVYHVGALVFFYRRFLKSLIKSQKTEEQRLVHGAFDEHETHDEAGGSCFNFRAETKMDGARELAELGLSSKEVHERAIRWLNANEDWVTVILSFHFCPDSEISETMNNLARRTNMSSNNYKISRLGVNWDATKAAKKGTAFPETMLGQWLENDLGLPVNGENQPAILESFKILCFEALNRRDFMEHGK